jgi:hypothetical protein
VGQRLSGNVPPNAHKLSRTRYSACNPAGRSTRTRLSLEFPWKDMSAQRGHCRRIGRTADLSSALSFLAGLFSLYFQRLPRGRLMARCLLEGSKEPMKTLSRAGRLPQETEGVRTGLDHKPDRRTQRQSMKIAQRRLRRKRGELMGTSERLLAACRRSTPRYGIRAARKASEGHPVEYRGTDWR